MQSKSTILLIRPINIKSRQCNLVALMDASGLEYVEFSKLSLRNFMNLFGAATVVISWNSHSLWVPIISFLCFSRAKIVFDLGYPYQDNSRTSWIRKFIFSAFETVLLWRADKVLVESEAQVTRQKSIAYKTCAIYCLENDWLDRERCKKNTDERKVDILWRGDYNRESGLPEILSALSKLDSVFKVTIHCRNFPPHVHLPPHFTLIDHHLDDESLFSLLASCKLLIGQMSEDDRLRYTIPHKFFESLFFSNLYLSLRHEPIVEFVKTFDIENVFFLESIEDLSAAVPALLSGFDDSKYQSSQSNSVLMRYNLTTLNDAIA